MFDSTDSGPGYVGVPVKNKSGVKVRKRFSAWVKEYHRDRCAVAVPVAIEFNNR